MITGKSVTTWLILNQTTAKNVVVALKFNFLNCNREQGWTQPRSH